MATIVLQAAGGIIGGMLGGPFGAMAGRALGALGGYAVDSALFSGTRRVEGPRLNGARILEADEGGGIARLYGTARIAGQIIWTTRFEESASTERQGGKGGGGGTEVTSYSYFGNVAIGLCEGPVAGIRRVWADGEELDLAALTLRLHRGTKDQMPDPLIEAKQGAGNAPAYRGLAYLVFERLPLEAWGNRIPQISCEVMRPVGELEANLRAVTIIPGASEHGLDPLPVRERIEEGEDRILNRNVLHAASDWEASLDELQALCPRLERAALVVAWFGTDLRAGQCRIRPGVETASRDETRPWRVGPIDRTAAHAVSRSGGGPAYGGTPSDAGVIRAIRDLRARGLKVTLYPFILMDVPPDNGLPDPYGAAGQAPYPWRGRITLDIATGLPGSTDGTLAAADAVRAFVGTASPEDFSVGPEGVGYAGPQEWTFRRMVLHQAHLAKAAGGVDAFVIGSELRGLTRIRDAEGRFPFVEALIRLAREVKAILPEALITYAADWSEYFGYQPADGSGDVFFNLDPLWADEAIGAIGIDSYLPLSDWRREDWAGGAADGAGTPYDRAALGAGIAGGEYFDWYYVNAADRDNRLRTPISDGAAGKPWVFRPKDLRNWWANLHHERRGGQELPEPTAWQPMSKPIWLTELGCPAVDKGANQPNVFIDPKSAESGLPHHSSGGRDDLIQRRFLEAHLRHWDAARPEFRDEDNPVSPVYGGRMVDASAIHLWSWDARPYPAFPTAMEIWSDGDNWRRGHWLTGRLGLAPGDALIAALLADHGFADVDVAAVDAQLGGYLLNGPGSARAELGELMRLAGVASHARSGRLVFRTLRSGVPAPRAVEALAEEDEAPPVDYRRMEESELPQEMVVGYLDPARSYQPGFAEAGTGRHQAPRKDGVELPVVLEEGEARQLAGELLAEALAGRETARFLLPPGELAIEPGDRLTLEGGGEPWLVTRIEDGLARRVEARRAPGPPRELGDEPAGLAAPKGKAPALASRPLVHFLDLPLPDGGAAGEGARAAIHARPWLPYALQASATGLAAATRRVIQRPATVGRLLRELGPGPEGLVDRGNRLRVELRHGALFSVTPAELLEGANLCAVQCRNADWEVLQFEGAEEVEPMRFELAGLVRAQGGTEDAMAAGAAEGAAFVLLDAAVEPVGLKPHEIGRALKWRIAPAGRDLGDAAVITRDVALGLRGVQPLSPVHLSGRFAAGGAFDLSWIRRTRSGGDSWDGVEVPFGEERELYEVTLTSELGVAIRRQAGQPALQLSAEEQLAEFGGLPRALTVEVRQLSIAFGAGTARSATFERSE